MKEKIIIYQVLPRLFGNQNTNCKENGTIEENGCGKLNNFTDEVLARIHDMGFTHIWYTGVIVMPHRQTTHLMEFLPNMLWW